LIIFDLAGTTVQDHGQIPQAFTAALNIHGIQATPEQIKAVRGSSKRQAILSFIPEGPQRLNIAEEAYTSFRSNLSNRYTSEGVHEIPGAKATFCSLREQGIKIALNTGFDREITELLLGALEWDSKVVNAVVCGDDVTMGRPAPYLIFKAMEMTSTYSVQKVANVGDTTLDLLAGYNAGAWWNIGVLTGAHDRSSLEGVPHTHLLSSVAELANYWVPA
jgi:phosphonatase-like hydrolase